VANEGGSSGFSGLRRSGIRKSLMASASFSRMEALWSLTRRGAAEHSAYRLAAITLLLTAWGMLLTRLDGIPTGFQHDQTFSALDALSVLRGNYPIYFPNNFGRGPLYMYSVAGVFRLTGEHFVWSLHFSAVIWGMLGLAATMALARRYLPHLAALFAAALMAGSFWFLVAARLGVESIALLPLATAMVYFLDRGLHRRSVRDLALAGILGGVANYTYLASRTLYLLIPAVALYCVGCGLWRRIRKGEWPVSTGRELAGLLLAQVMMLAGSAPLLLYLRSHGGTTDERINQLSGALRAASAGDLSEILAHVWDTVRSVLWAGSTALPYHYNVPGRPVLQPIWAVCAIIGLAVTIGRFRQKHEFLLLAALVLGLSPDFLTGADALYMRAIYALPLIFILTARGLWAAGGFATGAWHQRVALRLPRGVTQPSGRRWQAVAGVLAAILLIWSAADGSITYFSTWALAEQTQRIYNADFRAAAAYLDGRARSDPVFIGTDRLLPLDKATYAWYEPQRTDALWFQLPDTPPVPTQGSALYLLAASSEPGPTMARLAGIASERFTIPAPAGGYDLMQGFRLDANVVAQMLRDGGSQPLMQPVIFGDCLRLDSAGVQDQTGEAELYTSWTVLAPWPRSARPGYPAARPKLAIHLTDGSGYEWAQSDVTTFLPFQTWLPGQHLLEITPLTLPADLPGQEYRVRMVVYDDEQGPLAMRSSDLPIAAAPEVARVHLAARALTQAAPEPPVSIRAAISGLPLKPVGAWEELDQLVTGASTDAHVSWRATDAVKTAALGLQSRVRALDGGGRVLWEQTKGLAESLPPIWPAGQVFRLSHSVKTPADASGGEVIIEACVLSESKPLGCATLGRPRVLARHPLMAPPRPPQFPYATTWDTGVALTGYDLAQSATAISMTLYWQALPATSDLPHSVKRFVHAVDANQQIVAQSDSDLEDGGVAPRLWQPGEYVLDRVILTIPPGKSVSALYAGLYDPDSGNRLPVEAPEGSRAADSRVILPMSPAASPDPPAAAPSGTE